MLLVKEINCSEPDEDKIPKDESFHWADEMRSGEEESEQDDGGRTYSSVFEMLEDEETEEWKRLEDFLKKAD